MPLLASAENISKRLLGLEPPPLVQDERFNVLINTEIQSALNDLADAAQQFGFELAIASHYRSFDRQLLIWNEKAQGIRPVLDALSRPVDIRYLSDVEKIYAILQWSALPGASRHHWGTEVDVFDQASMPDAYQLQLTVDETQGGGVFENFHNWLTEFLAQEYCDFYRPYLQGVGGVAPEPWHLSYKPLAKEFGKLFNQNILCELIERSEIELKSTLLDQLPNIYQRYVQPYQ